MSGKRCPLCACHHVPKCQATARTSQWAIEPLLAIAGRDTVHAWCGERSTKKVIAAGGLSDVQADRWATRLGYHPVQIWGAEWVDAALARGCRCQPCSLTAVMPDGALAKIRTKTAA